MPAATGLGRIPKYLPSFSDMPDFTICYNPADIVLGGNASSTAPGSSGLAYWQPRGPAATNCVLYGGLLPVCPADTWIGRVNTADIMKHYQRRIYTSIKVFLTPEITNTSANGLFAIAATRGGSDTDQAAAYTGATLAVPSDTDVMTMKNALPFRIYDSVEYDATWAIAGGSGPKQNEFNIGNTNGSASTVLGNAIDGNGLVPCSLFIGGSAFAQASGSANIPTHRVILQMRMHLLDYRGTITPTGPLLMKDDIVVPEKPILPKFLPTSLPPAPSCSPEYEELSLPTQPANSRIEQLEQKLQLLINKYESLTH